MSTDQNDVLPKAGEDTPAAAASGETATHGEASPAAEPSSNGAAAADAVSNDTDAVKSTADAAPVASASPPVASSAGATEDSKTPAAGEKDVDSAAAAAMAAVRAATSDAAFKVFIGQVPSHMNEDALRPIFEPFGPLKEISILRDRATGLHKGCAFVFYRNEKDADRAIEALHDKVQLGPMKKNMIVRHANTAGRSQAGGDAGAGAGAGAGPFKLFVGMLSKQSDESRIRSIFEEFGPVEEVYIMKEHDGQSKGCAFVKFGTHSHAQAAIDQLHEKVTDVGSDKPLNVKWAANQGRKKAVTPMQMPGAMAMGAGGMPGFNMMNPYGAMYGQGGMYAPSQASAYSGMTAPTGGAGAGTAYGGYGAMTQMNAQGGGYGRAQEQRGPPGANIFVYNIPDAFGDADLATLFAHFGTILSTKVFCDKTTGASRGFGFVSFSSAASGAQAIASMNGFALGDKVLRVSLKTGDSSNQMAASAPLPYQHGMAGVQQRRYNPY